MITAEKTATVSAPGRQLFLMDARNRVEREYLLNLLRSSLGEDQQNETINWISLPISDDRADLPLKELADKLQDEPETTVVPLRIAWRIPDFEKSGGLKKRHILFVWKPESAGKSSRTDYPQAQPTAGAVPDRTVSQHR